MRPLRASFRRRPPPLPPTGASQRLPGTRGRCHSSTPTLAADDREQVTSQSRDGKWTPIDVLQRQTLASAGSSTSAQPSLQPARMSRRRLTVVSSSDIGSAKRRRCECHRRRSSPDNHRNSSRTLPRAAETVGRPPFQLPTGRLQPHSQRAPHLLMLIIKTSSAAQTARLVPPIYRTDITAARATRSEQMRSRFTDFVCKYAVVRESGSLWKKAAWWRCRDPNGRPRTV